MSGLGIPIREALRRPLDEVAERRIWNAVRAARGTKPQAPARSRVLLAVAALAVAAVIAFVLLPRRGPLTFDVDRVVLEVDAAAAAKTVRASDGSRIDLAPATRLEIIENSREAFTTLLSRGRATFDVVPGGGRRWTIDCGGVAVEVVGTAFTVERDARGARVNVERGEVVVRGERVPDRSRRLRAGESLEVAAESPPVSPLQAPTPAPAPRPAPSVPDGAPAAPSASASVLTPVAAPSTSASADVAPPEGAAWRDRARAGEFDRAYDALGKGGVARESATASVDELFTLADVARLSGHAAEAEAPLHRIVNEHGGDRRASMAALTLGRLYLDGLGRPAAAIGPLNRAIAAGLPAGLAEDALARRVEAYARSGNHEAARASLDELERRFPSSGRATAARRWVEPKE